MAWSRKACVKGGKARGAQISAAAKRRQQEQAARQAKIDEEEWERKVSTNEHEYPVD